MRGFEFLDLSHNKLAGKYSYAEVTDGNVSSTLYLEVNRLSGRFPSTSGIAGIGELSALRENLFACGTIPEEDEYSEEYSCGSEELDVSLCVFVSIVGLVLVLVYALHVAGSRGSLSGHGTGLRLYELLQKQRLYLSYLEDCNQDAGSSGSVVLNKLRDFSRELRLASRLFAVLLCLHLVTCLPLYALKISEYGLEQTSHTTHSFQYRWLFTAAYMRGEVSVLLLLLMWLSVMGGLCVLMIPGGPMRRWLSWTPPSSSSTASVSAHSIRGGSGEAEKERVDVKIASATETDHSDGDAGASSLNLRCKHLLIFTANASVVGCMYGVYIHFTSQSLPPTTIVGLQIGMALFNLTWNMVIVPVLARPMQAAEKVVWTELGLLIFNNILLPCIVTALTSPACFQVFIHSAHQSG